ncbi:MAG TPA: NAD-dependent epimerase/dehydratase family protein [Lacipirellulaceae bacterium]|jgi:nucleoside-diphosphate-sugar epimerase
MTSLVTGATGFIGRHLVADLTGRGERVRALYRDEQKRQLYLDLGEETLVGDACDMAVAREGIDGVDVVYHCAAAHSTAPADEIRCTNLNSVDVLFNAVREADSAARVVLMSSINVLGSVSFENANEDLPRRRTGDLHVDLKIAAEELAEREIAGGLNIVALRPGLVYGPGDRNLQKLAQAIYRGKFMYIGSRENIVPLVHVSDMSQAMILAGHATTSTSRVYNISDGSRTTIGQLVGGLARVMGCPEPSRVMPAIVPRLANSVFGLLGRSGPVSPSALRFLGTSRHVDIGRARSELGFEPRVGIAEGLQGMASWLRETTATESAA